MPNHAQYEWRTLRTDIATNVSDDDWADDESDALPTRSDGSPGLTPVSYELNPHGKTVEFEFALLGYVNATKVCSDNDADTYAVDVTYLIELPRGSSIGTGATRLARSGNTTALARYVAIAGPTMTALRFFKPYKFECSGAKAIALRIHTVSGAPGAADRLELIGREVPR
jgi:hypothetical protein